jgi:molybdopterin-guanine dinucleotide biosynthesis protein A
MSRSEPGPSPAGARYDAVVLAGGAARRLGGADKPGALVGGRSLIARVADAVADAGRLIIVGPARPEVPHALVVREDPPGGGPVPALRAGMPPVRAPWTALLAADLPFLRPADLTGMLDAAQGHSGAVLADTEGHRQWLAGVWRTDALRAALQDYRGSSLRGLLGPLEPALVAPVTGERPAWFDCDTPADLDRAGRLGAAGRTHGTGQEPGNRGDGPGQR